MKGGCDKKRINKIERLKIGCFHGKLNPEDGSIEAKLRNDLYLIGMLKIAVMMNPKALLFVSGGLTRSD